MPDLTPKQLHDLLSSARSNREQYFIITVILEHVDGGRRFEYSITVLCTRAELNEVKAKIRTLAEVELSDKWVYDRTHVRPL
jgi:ribosomal protein S5